MSDESQLSGQSEEKTKNQASGWFTAPSPEPSCNFFDSPPLLFSAFVWLFPYPYIIIIGLAIRGIVLFFQAFGLKASDFISLDMIKAAIVFAPFLFFLLISTKGTWFIKRIFFLLPVWLFLYWTMGVTQGAMMAALSKAYAVGQ